MDRIQDGCSDERAGGHAKERERADGAKRPRPSVPFEQVRDGGRGHRYECAASQRLDQARDDQCVERLRQAGEQRADRERDQGRQEQPPCAPHIGQPARQRHRDDVGQQVAVDDPGRAPQLGDRRGNALAVPERDDDRRQGDGRDHQFEAGQKDPHAQHDQEQQRLPAFHAGILPGTQGRSARGVDEAMRRA